MRLVLAVAIVAAIAAPAQAHQSSIKYADITVADRTASVKMTIAPSDVTQPLGMADAATPTLEQALAPATLDLVTAYVASWVALRDLHGATCTISHPRAAPDADHKFVDVMWDATCPGAIDSLVVDFTRFFTLDRLHEAILSVHAPGERTEPTVVRAAGPIVTLTPVDASRLDEICDFFRTPIAWIALAMLVVAGVVLARRR